MKNEKQEQDEQVQVPTAGSLKPKRGRKAIVFDASDIATNEWLKSFKKSTRRVYASYWHIVLDFAQMTGDEMLADRRNDTTGRWEKKALQMKQYMKDRGAGDLHARQSTVALRSFFAFHRVKLEMTHQESGKLRQATRTTEDYKFTLEDLTRLDAVGNVEEKYIVTVGKSLGLRVADFRRLTRGHFDAIDLEQKAPIGLGEYATTKEGVKAFPFIDSDAVTRVKEILAKMNREGRVDANERVITYSHKSEFSRVLRRLADRAGVEVGNKRVRFHCLRKFLTDRLSDVMSESKWKQIVGKTIGEAAYVSEERLRQDYERAMKETVYRKPTTEDEIELRAAQRALEMQLNMSVSMPPHVKEEMLKRIRAVKRIDELRPIEIEVGRVNRQAQHEAGGLSYEQKTGKMIAQMFKIALQELREEFKQGGD